ncbi:unnamed protein product [Penicillium nalgiovense]|uniref:Respiratory complex assembly protein Rmp1 n=1 Tax=Penicillium nalgiovense TaxID=60175 RepID=A0A9W4HQW4_PENNA|nr:unnamed protein product [Penicillium nalgiovense]CAG7980408.1 unnamed protein product [Penicillium nalgiovense]CAG7994873.1 unnamed protein product [Penicillium nalgiovense]CAG7995070.1 unnamed protein product [Penicillium nalgiovense]CAG7999502.1 unnamed protein product [Penicillium nalgiovense]
MLRRPASSKLGLLSFQSLSCRRPLLSYPHAVLPRYQSNWSRDHEREAFDGPNSERNRKPKDNEKPEAGKFTLDVDTLGKPGQIVVVPSRRSRMLNRNRNRNRNKNPEDESGDTISAMLNELDDEKSSPSDKSVKERIDEVRGSYQLGQILPAADHKALWSKLASSFTYKQLSDFISEYNLNAAIEEKGWTWRPSSSIPLLGKTKGFRGKSRAAETIVRNCWQLVADGEHGRLEFRMPAQFISLLLHAEHFSFHELASLHGCGIEVTQSAGLVSLTGKRNDCESVHEIIVDATGRIREGDVGINPYIHGDGTSQVFTPDFLEWVNNTHGVFVEHKVHRPPQKILYLAENKLGADNARRTLNLALSNTTSPSAPFSTYLPASELASAYSYRPGAHASWFEQQKLWFRWAMSSSQNAEAENLETPFFDRHQTRLSDELLKLLRVTTPQSSSVTGLHESVTAMVGKCLFMQKPSFDETAISPAQLGRMSLPRAFTNDIPLVSRFIDSLMPIRPKEEPQLYRLRLSPTSNAGSPPELEIEVAMNSNLDGVDVHSIKAILTTNSVDYLLPENGLDLRFTRTISQDLLYKPSSNSELLQTCSEHLLPDPPSSSPQVQEMLQSIKASLQGPVVSSGASQGPVPPPIFCNITLPWDLVHQPASQNVKSKKLDESMAEDSVAVEYMFPPLSDIRGAVVQKYNFDGRALDYRYYESGSHLAARTNEVSLRTEISQIDSAAESDESEQLDHEFHSFYNAACDMAFKVHGKRYVD